MMIYCRLSLLAVTLTLLVNRPPGLLASQRDSDDLYQSLVFSHYLQRQGVHGGGGVGFKEPDLYNYNTYNAKRDVGHLPQGGGGGEGGVRSSDPYDQPLNFVTPLPEAGTTLSHHSPTTPKPYSPTPRPYGPTPMPYQPAYATPEPYKPAYATPKSYQPAYATPKSYQPAYATPEPYQPAYATPEPHHASPSPRQYSPSPYSPTPKPVYSVTPGPYGVTPNYSPYSPSPYPVTPAPNNHYSPTPYPVTPAPKDPYSPGPYPVTAAPKAYQYSPTPQPALHLSPSPAPHAGTVAPYHGSPAPYHGSPAPYHPGSPAPYHPVSPAYAPKASHPDLKQLSPYPGYGAGYSPYQNNKYSQYASYPKAQYSDPRYNSYPRQEPDYQPAPVQPVDHAAERHHEKEPQQHLRPKPAHRPAIHLEPAEPVHPLPHHQPVEQPHHLAHQPHPLAQQPHHIVEQQPHHLVEQSHHPPSQPHHPVQHHQQTHRLVEQPSQPVHTAHTSLQTSIHERQQDLARHPPVNPFQSAQPGFSGGLPPFSQTTTAAAAAAAVTPIGPEPQRSPTPVPIFSVDASRLTGLRRQPKKARGGGASDSGRRAPLSNHIPDSGAGSSSSRHKEPKSAALAALYDIAGDDWDSSKRLDKSLHAAAKKFKCPGPEGHFPDPEDCSVYYQCAHGTSTQYTCQAGLKWNVASDQCDWEANVDCSLNKQPGVGGNSIFRYYKY